MKNAIFPHKFWRPFLDYMPQLFLDQNMCGFIIHICGKLWSIEITVYIIPPE